MKFSTLAATIFISAGLVVGQTAKATALDLSKIAVEKKPVKKELNISKPKTNWAKLKDLFM